MMMERALKMEIITQSHSTLLSNWGCGPSPQSHFPSHCLQQISFKSQRHELAYKPTKKNYTMHQNKGREKRRYL
jgi:hypothetical protein